jgi:hypothetical protein
LAFSLPLLRTQNVFKMTVDVPGVDADKLNIECEGNVLRLRCARRRRIVRSRISPALIMLVCAHAPAAAARAAAARSRRARSRRARRT